MNKLLIISLLFISCYHNPDKQFSYKDKQAAKNYKTREYAIVAYYQYLENENKYKEEKSPSRPSFIPQTIIIDSQKVEIKYGKVKDSLYAFGIFDTCSKNIKPLKKDYFIIDTSTLRNAGYGRWDKNGNLIYYQPTKKQIILWISEIVVGIFLLIVFLRALNK